MSNQPFTFPPPPPPPPRRTVPDAGQQQNNGFQYGRGAYRGGGNTHRGYARGGRGGLYSAHQHQGHINGSHGNGQNSTSRTYTNNYLPQRNPQTAPAQKRNHSTAFSQPNNPRSRPTAAPAVPSFNASIAHLLPAKPATASSHTPATTAERASALPKKNLLGLTPSHPDESSSSSDDEDEETRLSHTLDSVKSTVPALSFTYRGELSSLHTAAEIQAWIAERRKRFPTVAMADAAKKEREEKKRKWEGEKLERKKKFDEEKAERQRKTEEARRAREMANHMLAVEREARNRKQILLKGSVKTEEDTKDGDATERGEAKAEKLRKRALKAERELKKAEEKLRIAREKQAQALDRLNPTEKDDADDNADPRIAADNPSFNLGLDPDETSSSGSSSSDLDTGSDSDLDSNSDASDSPVTISTKDPSLIPMATSRELKLPKQVRVCKYLLKTKRCRYGSSCRFSHDLTSYKKQQQTGSTGPGSTGQNKTEKKRSGAAAKVGPQRRKSLFQVMVEKEEEEKRRKVARAIIALGESGFLDEPTPSEAA